MGRVIQFFVCFALLAMDGTSGLSLNRRMKTAEIHLRLLEARTDGQAEEILHIFQTISDLNDTILDITQCFPGEREKARKKSDYDKGGKAFKDDDIGYESSEIIISALKQEKQYVRNQVQHLSQNINKLNDVQEELNSSLHTSIEIISAEQSDLKDLVKQNQRKMGKQTEQTDTEIQSLKSALDTRVSDLSASIDIASSEQSDLKSFVKKNKEDTEKQIEHTNMNVFDIKTLVNEIMQNKLEDLERQISFLQSNADHCRCGIKCEATWAQYRGFCYKHFYYSKTWYEAKQACEHENAFLIDVEDQQEMTFLTSLEENATLHLTAAYKRLIWLGLTDRNEEGSWVWDRTGAKATYLNWRPGQPDSHRGNQDCAFSGYKEPYDKWNDDACTLRKYFICKK